MSYAYQFSNLKIVSDIELPELMPWVGTPHESDDVLFTVGQLPAELSNTDLACEGLQSQEKSRYIVYLRNSGKILVENGRRVVIEPVPGADTRSILMGPVQAVLWHQRGLLPLHASAICVNGRAVALAGPSGIGKSTLAAACATRNHGILADDICIIDPSNGVTVLPSTPRLRLWRQALDHFGIPPDDLPRASSRSEKYVLEGRWPGAEPQQLASVILLSRDVSQEITLKRVRGWRSFSALHRVVHMYGAVRSLGLDAATFTALGKLVDAGVSVWDLSVPNDFIRLGEVVEKVASTVDSCA